ncbi:MAG: hypothetical protein V3W41_11955 [Planctomycetota bacterium]
MSDLEILDASNWEEFLKSPTAVLMLGKSDCQACSDWTVELKAFLTSEQNTFDSVRFGKLLLDQRGLIDFKKQSPWLADVDVLPFNVIYRDGEKVKDFAGSGIERLTNRLERLLA